MSGQVQRQTVEYNSTIYGMENQLALLNIARAKEGLPTFYTSIGRLTGSITVKTAAGFGAQIKAPQPTTTASTTTGSSTGSGTSLSNMNGSGTSSSTAGATTTTGTTGSLSSTTGSTTSLGSTLSSLAQTAIARGGNVYTPNISGEIDSGPSFDIQILDTQQFYRGMLTGIDGPTFLNFIDQGADGDILLHLLVFKIDFKATKKADVTIGGQSLHVDPSQVVRTWTNAPLGPPSTYNGLMAKDFWPVAACYVLTSHEVKDDDTPIALVSRVAVSKYGKDQSLHLSDLSSLDGTQLALKSIKTQKGEVTESATLKKDVFVGSSKSADADLLIVKPSQAKEVAALLLKPSPPDTFTCSLPNDPLSKGHEKESTFSNGVAFVPEAVAAEIIARQKAAGVKPTGVRRQNIWDSRGLRLAEC